MLDRSKDHVAPFLILAAVLAAFLPASSHACFTLEQHQSLLASAVQLERSLDTDAARGFMERFNATGAPTDWEADVILIHAHPRDRHGRFVVIFHDGCVIHRKRHAKALVDYWIGGGEA